MRRKYGAKFVAGKIDLHKAYNCLRWEFIVDTLKDAQFPDNFIRLVMFCLNSVSMQVLWNGTLTEEFFPSIEVSQGDPIASYLFVVCIKMWR